MSQPLCPGKFKSVSPTNLINGSQFVGIISAITFHFWENPERKLFFPLPGGLDSL